jgi:hypothetical protein
LSNTVLEQLEVVGVEPANHCARLVANDDIDEHQIETAAKDRR